MFEYFLATQKRLINLSAGKIINVRNARLCAKCAIFLLRIKRILFCCHLVKGLTFLNSLKSIQDVIGDVYCPGEYCLNRKNCESIGGYVTTPRSIYGCGMCGASLFVHKVPFMLQEHVNTTKKDKIRVLFVWKSWICYPTHNCSLDSLLGTNSHQSQSPAPKKIKMSSNMEWTYPFPIGWWFEQRIQFWNQFIHFRSAINLSNFFNLQLTYRKLWCF